MVKYIATRDFNYVVDKTTHAIRKGTLLNYDKDKERLQYHDEKFFMSRRIFKVLVRNSSIKMYQEGTLPVREPEAEEPVPQFSDAQRAEFDSVGAKIENSGGEPEEEVDKEEEYKDIHEKLSKHIPTTEVKDESSEGTQDNKESKNSDDSDEGFSASEAIKTATESMKSKDAPKKDSPKKDSSKKDSSKKGSPKKKTSKNAKKSNTAKGK